MLIYLYSSAPLNYFKGVSGFFRLLDRRFTPLIYAYSLPNLSISMLFTNVSVPEYCKTAPYEFKIASPPICGIQ